MGDRDTPFDDYSAYIEQTGLYAQVDYEAQEDDAYERYCGTKQLEEDTHHV